jgi:hypothetical protein
MHEIDYIGRLADLTRGKEVDYYALAKAMDMKDTAIFMNIARKGTIPRPETLVRIAAFARQYDPSYSAIRLMQAVGWVTDEDLALYRESDEAENTEMTNRERLERSYIEQGISPEQARRAVRATLRIFEEMIEDPASTSQQLA